MNVRASKKSPSVYSRFAKTNPMIFSFLKHGNNTKMRVKFKIYRRTAAIITLKCKGREPVNHEAVLLMLKTCGDLYHLYPPVKVKVKYITCKDIYVCKTEHLII